MRSAFSLIELIVTLGIITVLLSFSSQNFLTSQRKTILDDQVLILSTDIRTQQQKAMLGDTSGSGTVSDYGIYFDSQTYTLFRGSVYNPADPDNYTNSLPETVNFNSVLFPDSQIVFQRGSGEILNFSSGQNLFNLSDSELGKTKTFTLNALGVIVSVQ